MNRLLWVFSLSLFIIGCGQSVSNNAVEQDTSGRDKNNSNQKVAKMWTDSLIEDYIHNSNNALIRQSLKNKISEEWLFDQTINTDTAKYFTFQIGHDVEDKKEKNRRFVNDQWIYIDSSTKHLYEYDVASDSLIRWTK